MNHRLNINVGTHGQINRYGPFSGRGRRLLLWLESHLNRFVQEKNNPFYFLGALTIFTLVVLVVTGVYLFIYYSPSVETVYESIEYVQTTALLGWLIRSIHHYASDLLIVLACLHLIRVFFQKKFRKYQRIAWVSGVVILFLMLVEGITGYMMIWNTRSQFVALHTSKLLAHLKVFGEDLPRSFSSADLLGTWIIWIILAIHILIPIAFVFLIYLHLSRVSRPRFFPSRPLRVSVLVFLAGYALVFPVEIFEKADFMTVPPLPEIDWFYLFFVPVIAEVSPTWIWLGTLGFFLALAGVPWGYRKKIPIDVADRNLEHCTGCGACAKDCPYEAIYLRPRTDGKKYKMESVVVSDRCAGCAICVGSCNFGGMNLTQLRLTSIEHKLEELFRYPAPHGTSRYLGIFCQNTVSDERFFDLLNQTLVDERRLRIFPVPCAGIVGPAFIKKAIHQGAEGVIIAACRTYDCQHREGNLWLRERLAGHRVPRIRAKDAEKPVAALSFSSVETPLFLNEVSALLDTWEQKGVPAGKRGVFRSVTAKRSGASALVLSCLALSFLTLFSLGSLNPLRSESAAPEAVALLKIDFFHLSDSVSCDLDSLEHESRKVRSRVNQMTEKKNITAAGQEQKLSTNLVSSLLCPRERVPVRVKVTSDGQVLLDQDFMPAGLKKDGLTYVHHEQRMSAGPHRFTITMVDSNHPERQGGIVYELKTTLRSRQVLFIDFNEKLGEFYIRER